MVQSKTLVALVALTFSSVSAIELDVNSPDSIKSAASTLASGLAANYHGTESGHVIGILDAPYYWWNAGAMWDTFIQYFHLTGDDQYNDIVSQGILAQQGDNHDFMPANQSKAEGNDDQGTWALAAMSAAEFKLPEQSNASWVSLADNTFNEQVGRWDISSCGGGLRWQTYPFMTGYTYKNSISNGDFFRLASRLARYTGNSTYSDWASKAFNWTTSIGFIDKDWNVYDGADIQQDCTSINKVQFSYVAGTFINGAAYMYNTTAGDSNWKVALDGLLNRTLTVFFPDGIATEVACEARGSCNLDMKAYKGLLAQTLVETIKVAPYTSAAITPLLESSAKAAAKACEGAICGFDWNVAGSSVSRSVADTNDTSTEGGLESQLSALSFVQALLVDDAGAPDTEKSGGDSATPTSGSGGSVTQTGTPASTSSGTGTGAPSPAGNAGNAIGAESVRIGILAGLLGSTLWSVL